MMETQKATIAPATGSSLANQRWLVIALVVLFFPVGFYLLWKSTAFTSRGKWVTVGVFLAAIVALGATAPKQVPTPVAQSRPEQAKQEAAVQAAAPKLLPDSVFAEAERASEDYTNLIHPLVEADKQLYKWCGILEQADVDSTLRSLIVVLGDKKHRFLSVDGNEARKFDAFGGQLRIGGSVCVAGRYIGNQKYTTVIGSQETMPVLSAIVIYM